MLQRVLLALLMGSLLTISSQAQVCTPLTTITTPGFYPADSLLPCVVRTQAFDQTLQFRNFDLIDGTTLGFPGITLQVIFFELTAIDNLPTGLIYTCNKPSCLYNTAENGCAQITGTTTDPPGIYRLAISGNLRVTTGGTPFTIGVDSSLLASAGITYYVRVIDPGDVCPIPAGGLQVNAGADIDVCSGDTALLGAAPTAQGGMPGYNYTWIPNIEIDNPNSPNPKVWPSMSRTYQLAVQDNGAQVVTDAITVTVNPTPSITAGGSDTVCYGESVSLNVVGADSFHWSPEASLDNPNIATPIASPLQTTTYTVEGFSTAGCKDETQVTVMVHPELLLSLSSGNTASGQCTGFATASASGGTPPFTYVWDDPSNQTSVTAIGLCAGTFEVTVTDAEGCVNIDTISVGVNSGLLSPKASDHNTRIIGISNANGTSEIFALFDLPNGQDAVMDVIDLNGRILKTYSIFGDQSTQQISIRTQDLYPGLYILKLSGEQGMHSAPFTLTH